MSDVRLSDVLARRGRLAPAEVVTLVGGLALDLDALHAAGGVHGAICVEAVEFAADGRPVLRSDGSGSALFVAPEVARGAPPGPAADVFAVAAIGYVALSAQLPWATDDVDRAHVRAAGGVRTPLADVAPSAPARLVEALEAGLADDPSDRCGARALAELVLASGPAAPLRLPRRPREVAAEPRPPRSSNRRPLVVLAMLIACVLSGVWLTLHGRATEVRWADVLARLDRARLAALTDRRVSELPAVYAPGSAPLARDAALIGSLVQRGLVLRGRLAELTGARLLSRSADNAALSVLEQPADYVLVDAHGHVVLRVRGQPRHLVVHLHRTRAQWRVTTVD